MSGIVGYIDFNKGTCKGSLRIMLRAIKHRGSDNTGVLQFETSNANLGLGYTGVSKNGLIQQEQQPYDHMNLSLIFDGEIFNEKEIRRILIEKNKCPISDTGTEIIFHAYRHWGIKFIEFLNGSFVIAIYDKNEGKLNIFRDRGGIKPIYYYWHNGLFLFASEIKSLIAHPEFKKIINKNVLALYFDLGYIPAPFSIFENTFKIEPGRILSVDLNLIKISHSTYWNVEDYYCKQKIKISYQEAKAMINDLLISSCLFRVQSDNSFGVTLSGGFDSTLVAAIIQKGSTERIRTYTIGFEEGKNEVPFARETARYLGTDHSELYCTIKEAQEIVPKLSYYYDEPFADDSAVPSMLLSQLIYKQVPIVLAANGGDHIFAGRINNLNRNLAKLNLVPDEFKGMAKYLLSLISYITPARIPRLKHKLKSVANVLNSDVFFQVGELLRLSISMPDFYKGNLLLFTPEKLKTKLDGYSNKFSNQIEMAAVFDYEMNLQNCLMTKVDRAFASTALIHREPLLDHRIIEVVAQLPFEYFYDGKTGKKLFKDILYEYVPRELMDRPKIGFSPPIYSWLRGDLKYLLDEFLNKETLEKTELLNARFAIELKDLFLKNKLYYSPIIWKMLMFQMWYYRWIAA